MIAYFIAIGVFLFFFAAFFYGGKALYELITGQ